MHIEFYGKSFKHEPSEFCSRRIFDTHFISFFLTNYVYEKDGRLIRGSSGDMLIIPAGDVIYHGPTPEMTGGFINDWVHVSWDGFEKALHELSLPVGVPFSVGGERYLFRFIEKVEREKAFLEVGCDKMIKIYLYEALIKIARAYKREKEGSVASKITAIRGEMATDLRRTWTLAEMAKRCGYSESRFSELYKSAYGISPMADLLNIRLENSKFLLLYSARTVSEIAFEVGFSNVFYFSSFFKKHVGVSPKEYRENAAGY